MELITPNEGLRINKEYNYIPLEINTNSIKIIKMLKERKKLYNGIIDDCRDMLKRLGYPVVQHSFRDQNGIEDVLSKQGATLQIFNKWKFW